MRQENVGQEEYEKSLIRPTFSCPQFSCLYLSQAVNTSLDFAICYSLIDFVAQFWLVDVRCCEIDTGIDFGKR